MPRELVLVGYKPNGPPALLVDSTDYTKVRAEFQKLRASGRLPKGFTMARMFDSENGYLTIYDEPTRRLALHESSAQSTATDAENWSGAVKGLEEQAASLKADIDAMQKMLDEVEAKSQGKRPTTDEEQGIRVLLPDKINAAKNAHGTLLEKLHETRTHHKSAQTRHETAKKELAAFKVESKYPIPQPISQSK